MLKMINVESKIYYFLDEWSLGEHIKGHTGQNKYFCNICNKICYSSNDLDKHIVEHTFLDLDTIKNNLDPPRIKEEFKNFTCNVNFYICCHLSQKYIFVF